MRTRKSITATLLGLLCSTIWCGGEVQAADWPTWRHDANRSAASTEQLPEKLHLQWRRDLPPLKPAWVEDPRLHFDASYEPIVLGKSLFLGSSQNDSVTAYDTDTGEKRWQYFADGPVRFAPVAWKGRLYFGADDGYFYCLDADSGSLVWKLQAAPADRTAIGNERLISVWPMCGGPVLNEGKLYFTVGVWPFEGALLYALDLDGDDSSVPKYTVTNLTDLSPQGYLVASRGNLFLPCGRATAHCLDLATTKPVALRYDSRGLTDYHVVAVDKWLFHGDKVVDIDTPRSLAISALRPVVHGGEIYFTTEGNAVADDVKNLKLVKQRDRRGRTLEVHVPQRLWRLKDVAITQVHVKAGERLYAHHASEVIALDLPQQEGVPRVSWKATVEGTPVTMLVANGKLFVVTDQGRLHCFAADKVESKVYAQAAPNHATGQQDWVAKAAKILQQPGTKAGYCLAWGIGSGALIGELLRQSDLHIIAVDPDAKKVAALRRRFDELGLYGTRVVAKVGDPLTTQFPPYLANLVVSEDPKTAGLGGAEFVQRVFRVLRPYGGTAGLEISSEEHNFLSRAVAEAKLQNHELKRSGDLSVLRRVGALPGSSDWTHEYGDPANTLMSQDNLVRAPFGVLWFGGPASSGELFYNRHFWGPSLTVIEGRMFIQGPKRLAAVDIYTGRMLWKKEIREGSGPGRRGNFFEKHKPGFHYVAEKDGVYLVYPDVCLRLDPATGKTLAELKLPNAADQWGRIRVWKDLLIVTVFRTSEKYGFVPVEIVAMNRHTGTVAWTKKAGYSFPLVAVGGDKVFVFDSVLKGFYDAWKRKGLVPKSEPFLYLRALDARTGKQVWERTTGRVATWLAYSDEHDVLVASNKRGIDALRGSDGEELWRNNKDAPGFGGHPENVWDKVIVSGNRIIDQRGPGLAYELKTGKPVQHKHPITGAPVAWQFTKTGHHCNYAIASPHLLTFRAASAGFFDRASSSTSRLSGFRSGCRNSLIPAGGVLNAPNYAHGCICSYNLFTSLALVHVPDNDLWTYSAYKAGKGPVERIGINFGAPGDRQAKDGTMWLDYPNVGGPSPNLPVKLTADKPRWVRLHSSQIEGEGLRWVSASGVAGARSITVPLVAGQPAEKAKERSYTVRLYFAELEDISVGERVFSVAVQGREVLKDLDVAKQVGRERKMFVHDVPGVRANGSLTITFSPTKGESLIGGIEVVAE